MGSDGAQQRGVGVYRVFFYADALDLTAAAGLFIEVEQHGAQRTRAFGDIEVRRKFLHQTREGFFDVHADNRVVTAGHADIGDVAGALGQDALVGGRHVRVGANDGAYTSVEVPAHAHLLARDLGVQIHEHHLDVVRLGREYAVG